MQAGCRRGLLDDVVIHVSIAAGLSRQNPYCGTILKNSLHVHEGIREISVAVAPPHNRTISDVVVVFISQLVVRVILNCLTQCLINVFVLAEFLDDIPREKTKQIESLGVSGRCHSDVFPFNASVLKCMDQ